MEVGVAGDFVAEINADLVSDTGFEANGGVDFRVAIAGMESRGFKLKQ